METLLVVEQHDKDQYYSRVKQHGPGRFGPSPSKEYRGINCRTFQSGTGILPTPSKNCTSPVSKKACSPKISTPSPYKTPIASVGSSQFDRNSRNRSVSQSVPIAINLKNKRKGKNFNGSYSFSELWAGPAYSNSPPPSSLPIPKFSVRPKRTVSLELPSSASKIELHPIAKSAPASPTREHGSSVRDFFDNADSATKTLRRILNLDVDNE